MFRKFLEWLYLFDFIQGDLANAMLYYLHPKAFIDEIIRTEAAMKDMVQDEFFTWMFELEETEFDKLSLSQLRVAKKFAEWLDTRR